MTKNKLFIYNPAQKTKEQLIAEFVVRKNIFEKIFTELKSAPRDIPTQHYLVAGQRGMGKTTLLLRLKYAVEDDAELKDFLVPIRFSEEQYHIVRLEHLWEETAALLESTSSLYEGLQNEMLKHEKEENYERICFELLEKKAKLNNQRILLMIDNIGDLLDKFPYLQDNRLREVLMTSPYIQLIGCSSKILEHTFQYDKPFFEFFNQFKLDPLDQRSTLELLRALGKEYKQEKVIEDIIKNAPQRIDVLRRITGGVPRTVALLFDIFIDNDQGNAFEDLQHLLDEVNPLYKHRMDELKPQQQQIIDALARAWDPIQTNEILERSKLYREDIKSNQISAQLKQLTDNQIVESLEDSGRKKTYRIRERFFNIWYLMRHDRKQNKEEVLWLIKFLEAWCSIKDMNILTEDQAASMQSRLVSDKAVHYNKPTIEKRENNDYETLHNIVGLLLKKNKIQEALMWADQLFKIEDYYKNPLPIILLLENLILHKQYHFLLNLFKQENSLSMKHASPFYYVLAYFLKDELPGVYEKAGSEIKETIDEIIKRIETKSGVQEQKLRIQLTN